MDVHILDDAFHNLFEYIFEQNITIVKNIL